MSPLTHWQVGALLANVRDYNLRERRLIMLAALAPDVDGVFIFFMSPDKNGLCLGQGPWFEALHHTFGHSVFYCLAVALGLALYNRGRRLELFLVCLFSSSLQLVLDIVTNDSTWEHPLFWPLAYRFRVGDYIHWSYLNTFLASWMQYSLMAIIFAGIVVLYLKKGRTFLELISVRLDVFLTNFIALPFRERCAVCGARAYYRESGGGLALCPNHVRFHLALERKEEAGRNGHD